MHKGYYALLWTIRYVSIHLVVFQSCLLEFYAKYYVFI